MKKQLLFFLVLFSFFTANGQQIQWATKVIKFSSDLGGKQNGIKRILGKPDVFPHGGSSPNAWTPKNALDGYEWVEVSFEKPQTVKQVAVFENLNAGCMAKIGVDTGTGKYQTVWTRKKDYKTPVFKATIPADHSYYFGRKRRKVQKAPEVINPGIENAILDNAVSGVVAVRVEFNFALLPGQKQIDAIGISDSAIPISAKVNTTDVFENLPAPKIVDLDGLHPVNPFISPDGEKLYVTGQGQEKDQIYVFTKNSMGKWDNKSLVSELNTGEVYNFVSFIGENKLIKGGNEYTHGSNETGYVFFTLKNGKYEATESLKITAYNNYEDFSDINLTKDGKVLIMALETDFTQGGVDLYFAHRKDDGTYGLLQNMGKVINSAADEGMFQLLSDQKTLLFSSNGFSGFGDFDIYVSHRLDDSWKNWSEPVNLGRKINSSNFEALPFYDGNSEILYYVGNQDGNNILKSVSIPKVDLLNK